MLLPACIAREAKPAAAPALTRPEKIQILAEPWRRSTSDAAGFTLPVSSGPVLIRGARLLIGDGRVIPEGFVALRDGKITAIGAGAGPAPADALVVEARGKVVTPGLIDVHSHLGVYAAPEVVAHDDGNEATDPVTAQVRTVDGFWPQDPGIERAVAGGITTLQILPGSANLIGGRAVTLKLRRALNARGMHFDGAADGLKMACGENPKRVYGERHQAPATRMGNLAGQRAAFLKARRLMEEWAEWRRKEELRLSKFRRETAEVQAEREQRRSLRQACERGEHQRKQCDDWESKWRDDKLSDPEPEDPSLPPARDLQLEVLAGALDGRVLVHVHCYRADDMLSMLALADEMGFKIRVFHHALEAYKIRHELARRHVGVATWSDWWGFKLEAYDGIPENLALFEEAGGLPIVHSDSSEGIQRLNQEAAKGMFSGQDAKIPITPEQAIRWLTLNPAWALGVERRVGTLEVGKDADLVIWSGDPFSVYTRAERVFIDGSERYNATTATTPESDFEARP